MPDPSGDIGQTTSASATAAAPAASPDASPASTGQASAVAVTSSDHPPESATTFSERLKQAAEGTSGVEPAPNAGPIPFSRHEQILTNARQEAATKAIAEYHAKIGYDPAQYPAETLARYAEYDRAIAESPVKVAYNLMQSALKNPKWAAEIKSLAARTLAGRNGAQTQQAQAAPNDALPGPDMDGGYSAAGLQKFADAIETRALAKARAEFQKELDPFRNVAETFEEQRKSAERAQYVETRTTQLTDRVSKLPLAKANEKAIVEAFAKMPAQTEADLVANMFEAYHAVVDPIIEGKSKQAAMAALSTQAQANSARPTNGKAGGVVPGKPVRFADALRANAAKQAAQ